MESKEESGSKFEIQGGWSGDKFSTSGFGCVNVPHNDALVIRARVVNYESKSVC